MDDVVAVVGAGPAGLMAAEVLAAGGQRVLVFDRMPTPGRKLLIAGRGGLNLTHSEPLEQMLRRYGPARPFLEQAIRTFPPEALRQWADALGQTTFVGSSGRVFPTAFKAAPLLRAWLARLGAAGVVLHPRCRWLGWHGANLLFQGPDGPVQVAARATVLAMGGASWARLGSDGIWAAPLRDAGVALAPFRPANSGWLIAWSEHLRSRFAGTPLKRIALSLGGTTVRGEAVLTTAGLEGGAVYALSQQLREALDARGAATLHLDLRPDLDQTELARRLAAPRRGQSMANHLRRAAALPPIAISLLHEAPGAGSLSPEVLAARIKALPLTVSGAAPIDRAISTAGGVCLSQLDERLMLRRKPGVFAAGEMLDWEAPTGGYLLQAAFSTGRAAGMGALAWLADQAACAER